MLTKLEMEIERCEDKLLRLSRHLDWLRSKRDRGYANVDLETQTQVDTELTGIVSTGNGEKVVDGLSPLTSNRSNQSTEAVSEPMFGDTSWRYLSTTDFFPESQYSGISIADQRVRFRLNPISSMQRLAFERCGILVGEDGKVLPYDAQVQWEEENWQVLSQLVSIFHSKSIVDPVLALNYLLQRMSPPEAGAVVSALQSSWWEVAGKTL